MAPKKHIHKYYQTEINGNKLWACAHDDCSHFMPKHLTSLVEGKKSICWNCGSEFVLSAPLMLQPKPACYDCNPSIDGLINQLSEFGFGKK